MATAVHQRLTRDARVEPLGEREPTRGKTLGRPGDFRHSSPPSWGSVRLAMFRGYGLT